MSQRPGEHGYMPNSGYRQVRAKVASYLERQGFFGKIDGQQIIMTSGAAGAVNVVLKTILDAGDEVIVPRPYFVEYEFYVDNHGGRLVLVDHAPDFSLDVEQIAAAVGPRSRAVLLTSPHNPTGRVYPRASLEALCSMLTQKSGELGRPILVLSDETYRDVLFGDRRFHSIASFYPNSFMCYSWSKAFSIAGERIGYIAVNPAMETEDWPTLLGSLAMSNRMLGFVNAVALMQHVISECMDTAVDTRHYEEKRRRLCSALDQAGYEYPVPEGAFYIFPRTIGPEAEFVQRAKKHLLLVVPGSAFGQPGHFRISFACSDETVDLACIKLLELAGEAAH